MPVALYVTVTVDGIAAGVRVSELGLTVPQVSGPVRAQENENVSVDEPVFWTWKNAVCPLVFVGTDAPPGGVKLNDGDRTGMVIRPVSVTPDPDAVRVSEPVPADPPTV